MPTPALLQAISRLDQAVIRAEAAAEAHPPAQEETAGVRSEAVTRALAELDDLIESIGGRAHG